MKIYLTLIILCLTFLQSYPQPKGVNHKIIGRNHLTNHDIQAKEYIFQDRIYNLFIDSTSNMLTIQLRGTSKNGKWMNNTGDLILYDLQQSREKWRKQISYFQGGIEQHDNLIIESKVNRSYCLNIENGAELWELKNSIYYVDPILNIGIGYRNTMVEKYLNTAEGIDLKTGNWLWNRYLFRDYGWNDVFHLSDSVIVVVAAGLHSLNLKNGKGWDHNMATGKRDDLVHGLVSNVLIDSLSIYFAGRNEIIHITNDGKMKWTHSLPDELTGRSSIFISGSNLFIINKGCALKNNRLVSFGTPYFASFELNTGKQQFLKTVTGKPNTINDFNISKDTIVFVFNKKVIKYSMIDGQLLSEKTFDTSSSGDLRYFLGSRCYLKKDSVFSSLLLLDSTKSYLLTNSRRIHVVNHNLDIVDSMDLNQIYLYDRKAKDYKFLSKGEQTIIIDGSNKEVARLNVSGRSLLVGSKLFFIHEKSILEADLSELIRN